MEYPHPPVRTGVTQKMPKQAPPSALADILLMVPEDAGRYRDWTHIGTGGTATVHKAWDHLLQRPVAIKILDPSLLARADLMEPLLRSLLNEISIAYDLRHDHICHIQAPYRGPQGIGIVMEFIQGTDLATWMNKNHGHIRQTYRDRVIVLRTIAAALAFAHTRIVHRDLKPANIFLRNGEIAHPVVMDFGISVRTNLEREHDTAGFTPRYAAPEQYRTPQLVDHRSDLFSLGVLAYELFTDRTPPCSLRNVLKERQVPRVSIGEITPPSHYCDLIPVGLDTIILQLLQYEPAMRIQTAGEVAAALDRLIPASDPTGKPSPRPASVAPTTRVAQAITVEGGTIHLGSDSARTGEANERPRVKVMVTSFRIDQFPVTNQDYAAFAARTGRPPAPLAHAPLFGDPDHPVVGLTFDEATAFARFHGGDLPTEAQWEYAARGGISGLEYPWGREAPSPGRCNIGQHWPGTTAVRAFPDGCNAIRLWDMCGNVWEWCQDVYNDQAYREWAELAGRDQQPPVNPVSRRPRVDQRRAGANLRAGGVDASAKRVIRGGSFDSLPVQGRCAFRHAALPSERNREIGFRVAYPPAL